MKNGTRVRGTTAVADAQDQTNGHDGNVSARVDGTIAEHAWPPVGKLLSEVEPEQLDGL